MPFSRAMPERRGERRATIHYYCRHIFAAAMTFRHYFR
jgi:hypothetical protein